MNNILFITWDGPQTTYMEGLFMPVFSEIQKKNSQYKFHILQFTWGDIERIKITESKARDLDVRYNTFSISRKPIVSLGSLLTVRRGIRVIKKYIRDNDINILIPRSTFPAMMINHIKLPNVKILFDADGMPLEERIESKSLKRNSIMYKILRKEEEKIIKKSDGVLVRSEYAKEYYSTQIPNLDKGKFFRITNGIIPELFEFSEKARVSIRKKLAIDEETILLVYAGSLGFKYSVKEMLELFKLLKKKHKAKFLILSNQIDYSEIESQEDIILKSVSNTDVINYLSAADFGLCLIQQTFSMKMVAATKLGEYLLAGLPVVLTSKIGDYDKVISDQDFVCSLLNLSPISLDDAVNWIMQSLGGFCRQNVRGLGLKYFSIQRSCQDYQAAISYLIN